MASFSYDGCFMLLHLVEVANGDVRQLRVLGDHFLEPLLGSSAGDLSDFGAVEI